MTQEIKVGDKVRLKEFPGMNPYYKGRICEVASIDNNGYVTFKEGGIHPKDYELELVEPCDRKTDFLQKLGALLEEYNADISACQTDFEEVTLYLNVDKERDFAEYGGKENYVTITAANIMDFEKE